MLHPLPRRAPTPPAPPPLAAAVDLLLGWGLAADAEVRGVSGTAIAAQALVSMMFAPAGLLLYLLVTRPLLSAPSARRRAAGRGAKRD
jgi:hypothetical protein